MLNSEIKYAMALTLIDGVGNINAKKLLAYCGNFTSVFSSNKVKLYILKKHWFVDLGSRRGSVHVENHQNSSKN